MTLDFTEDKAVYTNQLRDLGTTISYTPETIEQGTYEETTTEGDTQVYPARVEEMGIESEPVKAGILSPGDYTAAVSADNVIPQGSLVVARSETCRVVKISQGNLGIRRLLYLKIES